MSVDLSCPLDESRWMRAAVFDRYGPPDELRLEDVPVPAPGPDEVLIEVVATSVNLTDWECLRGRPLYARIGGVRRPARRMLGSDIAGRVESVGSAVAEFAPGDEVYGDNLGLKGGFAEYAVAPASALARKPAGLTFAEASTIPQAGAIALQGTHGVGRGTRFLINGGGGGSGTFVIQLAHATGAHVTAVDNAGKLDFMRSLGADEVIDHRTRDFTRPDQPYDVILDVVAHRSVFAVRRALAPDGRYRWVGGSMGSLARTVTVGALAGRLSGRHLGLLAVKDGPKYFEPVAERCAAGELEIRIDRIVALGDVADALTRVGEGRALGKVVVEVRSS